MVLDALIKIKNEVDPTLTFRRSCREGKFLLYNYIIMSTYVQHVHSFVHVNIQYTFEIKLSNV